MPISRVRSITLASMMLASPTPPMASVSAPTKPSSALTARHMPVMIDMNLLKARISTAFSSFGEKRCSSASFARTIWIARSRESGVAGVQTMNHGYLVSPKRLKVS